MGIIAAGGKYTGTHPAYKQYELEHHLRVSKANFVMTEAELASSITEAAEELKIPRSKLFIFNLNDQPAPDGYSSWIELLKHGEKDWRLVKLLVWYGLV